MHHKPTDIISKSGYHSVGVSSIFSIFLDVITILLIFPWNYTYNQYIDL